MPGGGGGSWLALSGGLPTVPVPPVRGGEGDCLRGAAAWRCPPHRRGPAARVVPGWIGWPSTKPCWAPPSMLSMAQPGRPSAPVTTAWRVKRLAAAGGAGGRGRSAPWPMRWRLAMAWAAAWGSAWVANGRAGARGR